jgi:hypothetical protein
MKPSVSIISVIASAAIGGALACASGTAHQATAESSIPRAAATATVAKSPVARDLSDADFTQHVTDLKVRIKSKLRSNDFSIVVERPFVVVGDESEKAVKQHATDTVKWAVDRLKQDFFKKDPNEILEIWLFKDDASYRKHAKILFGDEPSTPYGYYSSTHKALIMNINTGGGTLVHELVHPFMESNFPACPPWFNEGMGSLYEQCGEVEGHIHGYTNWRLPGLQRAIREKRLPSFEALLAMDAKTFYNDDPGDNYAQARYLCYYLQEKGLLQKFYQEFVSRQREDPSGFKSLQRFLGETDMNSFKTRWEKFVLDLRQGYSVAVE